MENNKDCVFCTSPDIKNLTIIENDLAWAFPTNIPITEGHTLISPKRCIGTLEDLTKDERLAVFDLADKITKSLKKTLNYRGFNFAWNQGELSGQSVPHFHLHIVPRKDGDTGLLGYDPRSMLYRTGDRNPTAHEILLEISKKIKEGIN